MNYERRLIIGLMTTCGLILGLALALAYALEWSGLAMSTLLFCFSITLAYAAQRCYRHWQLTLMNLTSYTQLLREGTNNIAPIAQQQSGLYQDLVQEIEQLASQHQQDSHPLLDIGHLMDEWPMAIAIFDDNNALVYRNNALLSVLKRPLLVGSNIADSGFIVDSASHIISHPSFAEHWQSQTMTFNRGQQQLTLFSATDISQPLKTHGDIIEQNLIRVFSHELRNSLTPMASMTDTLLSTNNSYDEQTTLVLNRINQRSNHLLQFIASYAELSHLPTANLNWFESESLINEAKTVLPDDASVMLNGEKRCFGDRSLLSMVLINVFKNALQASTSQLEIQVSIYVEDDIQFIEIIDNGEGFQNLNNANTPFYSTKHDGNGIGLALSRQIAQQHSGKLNISNCQPRGAKIKLTWPIHKTQSRNL
ncbi:MAG: sensor histidine kinase [Psychrobium sp.]